MSDLIKRLRGWPGPRGYAEVSILRTMTEAADEIEKLRAALKEVLANMPVFPAPAKHIVGMADQYNDAITKARAALGETQ